MIEACARSGYARATAIEVTTLAGVSKKTLYKHFGSKDGCFLSTYDLVVREAVARISTAYRGAYAGGEADPAKGLCRAFDAFAEELVKRPASSRVALVDVLTVAPSASDRIEDAEAAFATMISAALSQGSDGVALPPPIIRALIGGVWFVSRRRLLDGRPKAVKASAAELGEWLLAYRSPAAALLPTMRTKTEVRFADRRVDVATSARGRMLQAAARVVARGGSMALSQSQVVEGAGVSAAIFAAEFEDTDDCFLSMLDWLSARAFAEALRASEAAPSWAVGICRAVRALFCGLAADPALARAAFLDAFAVDSRGAERRAAIMSGFADVLVRRAPAERRPSPLVAEAIVGSIWSIAHRHVAQGHRQRLMSAWPYAAFVAVAPIIGADSALTAISEEEGRVGAGLRLYLQTS